MRATPEPAQLKRAGSILSRVALSLLALILLLLVCVAIYLSTPLPASQLSRLVSSQLGQTFIVEQVKLSGATLVLKGVRLKNPDGFPDGALVAADSVAVAPQWGSVLQGGQRFRLIELRGIEVDLQKDGRGSWNFSNLQQVLAARKRPAAEPAVETYIRELSVKDGAVKVQGQGVQGINLRVLDLTTKGSRESAFELSFDDPANNRYQLKGKARAGKDAALDLALAAPSLDLEKVARLFKVKKPDPFRGGKGALRVNATLDKGELSTRGDFDFSRMRLPLAGAREGFPLEGTLRFALDYNTQRDTLRLESANLMAEKLVKLRAEGVVKGVRGQREFSVLLAMEQVDLGLLNLFISQQGRKGLIYGGRLSCESLRLEGDRSNGLKGVTGTLKLTDGSLGRSGVPAARSGADAGAGSGKEGSGALPKQEALILKGVSGTAGFSRQDGAIVANGKLAAPGGNGEPLIERLETPFALKLTTKLKLMRAEFPSFSAAVGGIPLQGSITVDTSKANPLFASLQLPETSAPLLNPLLKKYGITASSGRVSASVEAAGKGGQELTATAKIKLSALRGNRGKEPLAVEKGSVTADLRRTGGNLTAVGGARLAGVALNGKVTDADFNYRLANRLLTLSDANLAVAGMRVSIDRLSAQLPAGQTAGALTRYPLHLDFEGALLKQRDLELSNLAGKLRATLYSDRSGRWLEGSADVSSRASWQSKVSTAPVVHLAFSRSGAQAKVTGQALGGSLAGTLSFNPFAPAAGSTFDVSVAQADLAATAQLLPRDAAVRPAGGRLDLRGHGSYSASHGLLCRFESKGKDISLNNREGRNMISGAALSVNGALGRDELTIGDALLSAGPEVVLRLKGTLTQPMSPKRQGTFTFALQQASLNGIIDPFVNILPPSIQEAAVAGSVAAEGKIDLAGGRKLIQGALQFKGGGIEIPSQKLAVTEINGSFPLSLDLSGKMGGNPESSLYFSRENYPKLLEQMRKSTGDGEVITVGKITFGAQEFGKTTLRVKADNGVTQISSLTTSLYEGAILGRGYIAIRNRLNYRGDLLVNGLSMRALSRTLPMQGYISGRVDGVVSLNGTGKGLANLTGFVDLWAREGKGEKMVVSKEFLQRLAKQKLTGFFFSSDRHYDEAEIKAMLQEGDLTFDELKIVNTNIFGVRDLSVTIAPGQNRIGIGHLLESIREAAVRGKPSGDQPAQAPTTQEFRWGE